MAGVKINCAQIPSVEVHNLCRTFLAAIERFYEDPENEKRFEAWQQRRKAEGKSNEQSKSTEIQV